MAQLISKRIKPPVERISRKLTLYRNDAELPPDTWSKDFKNAEYQDTHIGDKNKAGHFFLTDSINLAQTLWWLNKSKGYHLTECHTTKRIDILDFSFCYNNMQMLWLLVNHGADILTKDFKTYEEKDGNHVRTFADLREDYNRIIKENDEESFKRIDQLYNYDLGVLGQRFTDGDNGFFFEEILRKENVDGYRWRECNDQRGFTYCLFNSSKLTPPIRKFVALEEATKHCGFEDF